MDTGSWSQFATMSKKLKFLYEYGLFYRKTELQIIREIHHHHYPFSAASKGYHSVVPPSKNIVRPQKIFPFRPKWRGLHHPEIGEMLQFSSKQFNLPWFSLPTNWLSNSNCIQNYLAVSTINISDVIFYMQVITLRIAGTIRWLYTTATMIQRNPLMYFAEQRLASDVVPVRRYDTETTALKKRMIHMCRDLRCLHTECLVVQWCLS